MRTSRTGSRGLTLVELAAVLAIMAMTAAAVTPAWLRFHQRAQLRAAAGRIVALAAEARGLALSGEATVAVFYDPSAHGFRVRIERPEPVDAADAPAPLRETPGPDARLLEIPLDVQVTVENPRLPGQPLVLFAPEGRADPARIRLERPGFAPIVLTFASATGRPQLAFEEAER